jgi:Xaa-Pro aminopeptidase
MHPIRTRTLVALLALAAPCAAHAQPGTGGEAWTIPATRPPAPIPAREYAARRARMLDSMGSGVLVLFGSDEPAGDRTPFVQNTPFRYLTGLTEPGARLVIDNRGATRRELLFVRPRDPAREVWDGARLGTEGARALTGIEARPASALNATVDSMLTAGTTLFTVLDIHPSGRVAEYPAREHRFAERMAEAHPGIRVAPVNQLLMEIRALKSELELDHLRRAIYITVLAHREAMRAVEPGHNEFEIQALIEGTFRRNGADGPSFGTIVASGPNSTTLHYRSADRFMEAGETVVMDIGASYRGYAADVTRTLPVSGRFSPGQRAVYEIVLAAQKAGEAKLRPGATAQQVGTVASEVVAAGLARLGLIDSPTATYDCGAPAQPRKCPQWTLFYMHGFGHAIGMDVHDADPASFGGTFVVGSAFTIEPGIYVRGDVLDYLADTPANRELRARRAPAVARYRNIGVRIEDDYFVTANGAERVSAGAPREVAEIEAMMAQPGAWNATRVPEVVEWYRRTGP